MGAELTQPAQGRCSVQPAHPSGHGSPKAAASTHPPSDCTREISLEIRELPHFSLPIFFPFHSPHMLLLLIQQTNKLPRSCTLLSTTKSKAVVQSFAVDGAGHEFPMSPGARGGTASSSRQGGGAEAVGTSTSPGPQGSGLGHTGRGRKQEKKKVLEYHKRAMYFHYPYLQMPAFKKKAAN